MEGVVVTTRTIKLPGEALLPNASDRPAVREAGFCWHVCDRATIHHAVGCVRFRVIIQMAVHIQMAFAIMFMDMNMDTATIHPPDQLHAKI